MNLYVTVSLPSHDLPFAASVYPLLQEHAEDPKVLEHTCSQPDVPMEHSSISEKMTSPLTRIAYD